MATAVVSGRVDEAVKHRAEVVMRKAGLSPTEIIQNVWNSMALTGEVPVEARAAGNSLAKRSALERLDVFLESLPPVNGAFAGMADDELLALKALDDE